MFEPVSASTFSFLRGASQPDELVWAAKGLGLLGLGVADRNTVAGVVRAHVAAKEAELKLIVGARLLDQDGFETVVYPKDRAAWGRLCKVLTRGNRRARKAHCELYMADVLEAMEGACAILMPPPQITQDWLDAARIRMAPI
jgi:error-prone DNA polymerase